MSGVGAFISAGKSLDNTLERVRLAEEAGLDSVYVTHIAARDSLTLLMAYAAATERVRLGTGVMPIASRTPVATAQMAATVDEYSGGRLVLGLGVSHQVTVENWFDGTIEKPVTQMREYVSILRALFSGEPPPEDGRFYRTRFGFMGYGARADLPIYVAALSPNMLRLAGEIADGVVLWLCNPDYIRETVVPHVREGREKAGKGLDGFDIVAAVPSAVAEDAGEVRAVMRQDLITYLSLPFYRAMLERSGFGSDLEAFDAGMAKGDVEAAKSAMSDELLGSLAGIGDGAAVEAKVREYLEAGATSPCVGPIPRSDAEATLRAAAGATIASRPPDER